MDIEKMGNGYDGWSMSNNARDAYANGEMPISKWSKTEILNRVREINPKAADLLKNVSVFVLKEKVLKQTSWHHTSMKYNKTAFYIVDEDLVNSLTEKQIAEWSDIKKTVSTKTYAKPGSGLIKIGGTLIPFENDIPKDTEIYRLLTTKPGEAIYDNGV